MNLHEARGYGSLDPDDADEQARRMIRWVNVPARDLPEVLERSIAAYLAVPQEKAFGAPAINEAWQTLQAERLEARRQEEREQERAKWKDHAAGLRRCRWCIGDTGYQIVRRSDGTTAARPCVCGQAGPKSEQPLSAASGWSQNARGEWFRGDGPPVSAPPRPAAPVDTTPRCPECGRDISAGPCQHDKIPF